MKDIDFNEGLYEVDFILNGKDSIIPELIYEVDRGSKFYGQGNEEPQIAIKNIFISKNAIEIIGAKQNTLKFKYNNITYIKFNATDLIEKIKSKNVQFLKFTVVGKANVNEWMGRKNPQILIQGLDFEEEEMELLGF